MATVKKGSKTTARRRATASGPAPTAQQSNDDHARSNAAAVEPAVEEVRKRAYELFLARDATDGQDLADWFAAEQELRAARRA